MSHRYPQGLPMMTDVIMVRAEEVVHTRCLYTRNLSVIVRYIINIELLSNHSISFSRFRAGSHTLEIERGRYNNPRTPMKHI